MPCLGLVGGLGVGATIHYYESLCRSFESHNRTLDIVIVNAQVSTVFKHIRAGDKTALAEYLNNFIHRLQDAGAEVIAIPAVTPHFCITELSAISPLPIFNILEPLLKELRLRPLKRIAVFGTRFVMESNLYGLVESVEIIKPRADEMDYIHNTYVELASKGMGSELQYDRLTELAQTLCNRDSADAIVLAGTDLAILFNASNIRFPYVDSSALHLKAILQGLL